LTRSGSFSSEWEAPPSSSISSPAGQLKLLVLGHGRVLTVPVPAAGALTLGSARSCQVVLDEPGVAPLHATLTAGDVLSLRDEGGGTTMVGTTRLPPGGESSVAPGVVIQLGGVAMVVQASRGSARLRHVRSHDYFEGRLEDECERAEAQGGSFAVVRLRFDRRQARRVEHAFSRLLRNFDLVAMYAADEYELLLTDATAELAQAICQQIADDLRSEGLGELGLGQACWPRDGRSPEALLAQAGAAIHGGALPGRSALVPGAIEALHPLLERVAPTTINVLILGETGVGKEVLARHLHELSPRASKPLLCLNCAAFSESLLESELFGHERGAFTGASHAKPGLLEAAEGGTVLLDEVGELPLSIQAKLLRVVEHRQVTRIGGLTPRDIDVRFLAATNRDLEADSARGTFRSDLYFRLNGISLVLPPLRERAAEIAPLARSFIEEFAKRSGRAPAPELSRAALSVLERYAWPGNVRELRNVVERAVMLCPDSVIDIAHLPVEKLGRTLPSIRVGEPPPAMIVSGLPGQVPTRAQERPPSLSPGAYAYGDSRQPPLGGGYGVNPPDDAERHEQARIQQALERCVGNQTQAARMLGMTRRALITRLERYGIPRPRKRPPER